MLQGVIYTGKVRAFYALSSSSSTSFKVAIIILYQLYIQNVKPYYLGCSPCGGLLGVARRALVEPLAEGLQGDLPPPLSVVTLNP